MAGITKVNGVNVLAGNGLGPKQESFLYQKLQSNNCNLADLNSIPNLGAGGTAGTDDAVTVAGVDFTSANVAHVAVQGTGALTAASTTQVLQV